ncbi:MAG: iron-sulfur protein [Thermotogota bacterium]|nr:iron-sulfur protein [Thermotogota bacterium]
MKVTVFNGSPKGKHSVTYQSIRYLEVKYNEFEIKSFNVGQEIKKITTDRGSFDTIMESVKESQLIIWCYPVYTFLTPYQVVKFNELIFERHAEDAFKEKFATQISTSKHFYDITAHDYVKSITADLGMTHLYGHMADMDDLLTEKGQKRLEDFGKEIIFKIDNNMVDFPEKANSEKPQLLEDKKIKPVQKIKGDKNVILLTDNKEEDSNLTKMITWLVESVPYDIKIVNLNDMKFQGGCLGCFKCAANGKCIYTDGFDKFHKENVLHSDCVIYAADINRHWFNAVWKCYDDRQFYNGHRTSSHGNGIGYLISGNLSEEHNLRTILEARSEVGGLYLTDIVTDESDTETVIERINQMAKKITFFLENRPERPRNFYGTGGMKIFRDLIYVMRGLMKEDHKFYKREGLYDDFPQRQKKRILFMQLIGFLLRSKKMGPKIDAMMKEKILEPYEKILKDIKED